METWYPKKKLDFTSKSFLLSWIDQFNIYYTDCFFDTESLYRTFELSGSCEAISGGSQLKIQEIKNQSVDFSFSNGLESVRLTYEKMDGLPSGQLMLHAELEKAPLKNAIKSLLNKQLEKVEEPIEEHEIKIKENSRINSLNVQHDLIYQNRFQDDNVHYTIKVDPNGVTCGEQDYGAATMSASAGGAIILKHEEFLEGSWNDWVLKYFDKETLESAKESAYIFSKQKGGDK